MSIRTPLARVRGLGSARSGTEHWWQQRVTAVANLPLAIFGLIVVVSLVGADHATVVGRLGSPPVAIGLMLLVLSVTWHMRLGMQVIIEDYVQAEGAKVLALLANTFFALLILAACVFALLKISLGA